MSLPPHSGVPPPPSPGGVPPAPPQRPPGPLRLLLVEDSFLVAHSLARLLADMGVEVVGPANTVRAALALIDQCPLDGGILDVNLGGGDTALPIAEALAARNLPIIFITGYSSPPLPDPRFDSAPHLTKPVHADVLRQTVLRTFPPPP